jgi:hypothetical protein
MLNLIVFKQNNSLHEFYKSLSEERVQYITPSPLQADQLRAFLPEYDIVTISYFLNNILSFKDKKLVSKSELLLELYFTLESNGFDAKGQYFFKIFEIVSELRSHTQDIRIIDECLPYIDENYRDLVVSLFNLFQTVDITDEVSIYTTHDYWKGFTQNRIVLTGFEVFSPVQIDWLNEISKQNDVYLSIPENVYENRSGLEWVDWLNITEVVRTDTAAPSLKLIRPMIFRNNDLKPIIEKMVLDHDLKDILYIANNLPTASLIFQDLPERLYQFSIDYWKSEIQFIEDIIKNDLEKRYTFKEIKDLLRKYLKENQLNKKRVKVITGLYSKINQAAGLIGQKEEWRKTDLLFLINIVSMDLTRIFMSPVHDQDRPSITIHDLSNYLSLNQSFVFIASKELNAFNMQTGGILGNDIYIILSKVGPIKTTNLLETFLTHKIAVLASKKKAIFLLEESLYESNYFWKKILAEQYEDQGFERVLVHQVEDRSKKFKRIYNSIQVSRKSYSGLQSYADCPRRFYHTQVEKNEIFTKIDYELLPFERGQLAHSFIESYISNYHNNSEKLLDRDFYKKELLSFLKENLGEKVRTMAFQEAYIELNQSCYQVVSDLCEFLRCLNGQYEIEFEKNIIQNSNEVIGRADCIIEWEDGQLIIDFKRSESSVPNLKQIESFEKFQSWFYLSRIAKRGKAIGFKYYCLLSPSEGYQIGTLLKAENVLGERVKHYSSEEFGAKLDAYKLFEQNLWLARKEDREFKAKPKSAMICRNCHLKFVCQGRLK